MRRKVGFIGVGSMGSALAGRLVESQDLFVYDKYRPSAEKLIARGASFADLDEIAATCDFIFTCLPAPKHLQDLFFGADSLVDTLRPGTVVIDMTTSTPSTDDEIARALTERSVDFADSPIAGGTRRVEAGQSTLMVGASPETFAKIESLLHVITENVKHVGAVGSGHTMKLVNNLLNACNRIAAMEAIRIATATGIPKSTVLEVINEGSARNYTTEVTYPELLSGPEPVPTNFALELYLKDVRLANEIASAHSQDNQVGKLIQNALEDAERQLGGRADISDFTAKWTWESSDSIANF